jgi:hypothetical protein
MVKHTARGTFEIELKPGSSELEGTVNGFDFTKTFRGDLQGDGIGVMLSSGDPQKGAAGYVAIEMVNGQLGDHRGRFALQQLAPIHNGSQTLHYEVVPGPGSGSQEGITGTFVLTIESDGTHRYELEYEL